MYVCMLHRPYVKKTQVFFFAFVFVVALHDKLLKQSFEAEVIEKTTFHYSGQSVFIHLCMYVSMWFCSYLCDLFMNGCDLMFTHDFFHTFGIRFAPSIVSICVFYMYAYDLNMYVGNLMFWHASSIRFCSSTCVFMYFYMYVCNLIFSDDVWHTSGIRVRSPTCDFISV